MEGQIPDEQCTVKKEYAVGGRLASLSLDMEWTGFSTERTADRFQGHMYKHRFCLLFWPLDEVLVIFYFIVLAHKHTPLFLLVSEQSSHRFRRDVPHIQILH